MKNYSILIHLFFNCLDVLYAYMSIHHVHTAYFSPNLTEKIRYFQLNYLFSKYLYVKDLNILKIKMSQKLLTFSML